MGIAETFDTLFAQLRKTGLRTEMMIALQKGEAACVGAFDLCHPEEDDPL